MTKNDIRRAIKQTYLNLAISENQNLSLKLFENICNRDVFLNAKKILAFWSLPNEPFTHQFCIEWFMKKEIYLPVIEFDILKIKQFTGTLNLKRETIFGVYEPSNTTEIELTEIDLILVPGLAFQLNGNRLGRGKGFYDKLLKNSKAYKIGICYSFQIVDHIPVDDWDETLDEIVYV